MVGCSLFYLHWIFCHASTSRAISFVWLIPARRIHSHRRAEPTKRTVFCYYVLRFFFNHPIQHYFIFSLEGSSVIWRAFVVYLIILLFTPKRETLFCQKCTYRYGCKSHDPDLDSETSAIFRRSRKSIFGLSTAAIKKEASTN